MITRFKQSDIDKEFDIIIIGGGINGCGIARDAALRGLSVLLLEKKDFGYGCTSASTRLIHGGLRYLEYFEFGLVRESLEEREILLKNASHLVKPLELCIPIYKNDKRSKYEIKAGMLLYDILSQKKSLPKHKMINKNSFINYEPHIKSENLVAGAIYHDAQVSYPERICIENILMAEKNSAIALNYAEVIEIKTKDNKIEGVFFEDKLTGKNYSVKGKEIINVTGPWVDNICNLTNKNIEQKIGGTKGTHIIINKFKDCPTHAIYAASKKDNRPFFIIPWNNQILIGTTDTYYNENLDTVHASKEDKTYLITEANNLINNHKITEKDILYSYAGIRPLPYIKKDSTAGITRRHIIQTHDEITNLTSIIGGKLTTYRNLSEQTVDLILKKLKKTKIYSKTKKIKYLYLEKIDIEYNLKNISTETLEHLRSIYGEKHKEILNMGINNPEYLKQVSENGPQIIAEIIFSIHEKSYTISDLMLRRNFIGFNNDLGVSSIDTVSTILKKQLNYSSEEINNQITEYLSVTDQRKN